MGGAYMAKILIYSEDAALAEKWTGVLANENHQVMLRDSCKELVEFTQEWSLIVLDARMKWTECRPLFEKMRRHPCPVLFYTEDKRMVCHLRALYKGPSDVLTHPFSQKAFLEKVSDLLKKHGEGKEKSLSTLKVDEKERVALVDGERIELTAQEYALLLELLENADMPVSREELLYKAWGYQSMGETRTVDVHVQRLRRKLGEERIETVYKCGYRLKLA